MLEPASRARPGWHREPDRIDMARTRAQIHEGKKIALRYRDEHGRDSERTIWPIAIGYHEAVRILAAWCELRKDFRSFRTDRVIDAVYLDEKYPERRDAAAGEMAAEPGLGSIRAIPDAARRRLRFRLNASTWRTATHRDAESPCQACGACCAYSWNWPRFTTEDDAALDLIPAKFVNERLSGMRCDGDRCSALSGQIGVATVVHDLCGAARGLPDLHARRCRMRHGAAKRHGLPRWEFTPAG